jgi:hypothetical protein
MREAQQFLRLVWGHWRIILTGGSLIAFLFLWQITGKSVQWWVYAAIAVLTLFASCFLTWREEYKTRIEAKQQIIDKTEEFQQQLDRERDRSVRAETLLAEEKANKLSLDEIVLREARTDFRELTKQATTVAPRSRLNERWVEMVAKRHGLSADEINKAIDRLDGKFHWQS